MTKAIEIKNLSFGYEKNIPILKNINLEIHQGEIFGLLGPNGAGKTTLLSFLSAYRGKSNKKISILGKNISALNSIDDWKVIAHAPQELAVFPELSAYDNLLFFAKILKLSKTEWDTRITEVLNIVDLNSQRLKKVEHFSGGMKRRLNLAVALLGSPQILILDEPTVGVDPQSRNFIFDKILELKNQGISIIYTTHYMEEIERLCKRIAILHQGEVKFVGDISEFKQKLNSKSLELGFLDLTGKEVQD